MGKAHRAKTKIRRADWLNGERDSTQAANAVPSAPIFQDMVHPDASKRAASCAAIIAVVQAANTEMAYKTLDEPNSTYLLQCVNDNDPSVRCSALRALRSLVEMQDATIVNKLVQLGCIHSANQACFHDVEEVGSCAVSLLLSFAAADMSIITKLCDPAILNRYFEFIATSNYVLPILVLLLTLADCCDFVNMFMSNHDWQTSLLNKLRRTTPEDDITTHMTSLCSVDILAKCGGINAATNQQQEEIATMVNSICEFVIQDEITMPENDDGSVGVHRSFAQGMAEIVEEILTETDNDERRDYVAGASAFHEACSSLGFHNLVLRQVWRSFRNLSTQNANRLASFVDCATAIVTTWPWFDLQIPIIAKCLWQLLVVIYDQINSRSSECGPEIIHRLLPSCLACLSAVHDRAKHCDTILEQPTGESEQALLQVAEIVSNDAILTAECGEFLPSLIATIATKAQLPAIAQWFARMLVGPMHVAVHACDVMMDVFAEDGSHGTYIKYLQTSCTDLCSRLQRNTPEDNESLAVLENLQAFLQYKATLIPQS